MEITVKKLTPDLIDAYFYFFDHVAFTDNPRWASCYCYHYSNEWEQGQWDQRTGEENRAASRAWIESGGLNGYLAFVDDQPVGWCHANDKTHLPALASVGHQVDPEDATDRTGSIICYIVAPSYRNQGVATRLLQAACAGFEQDRYARVEAYPNKGGVTVQDHYHGPLEMYRKQGFVEVGEVGTTLILHKNFR